MKFSLVFDTSGDHIDFDVVHNADILQYLVESSTTEQCNEFGDGGHIAKDVDRLLTDLRRALTLTNAHLYDLCGLKFAEHTDLLRYLDQGVLNQQHENWVDSQKIVIDIDRLRFCSAPAASRLGWQLHDQYSDDIRQISLAEAMSKLGYIWPYEEVNMTVHRLEAFWRTNIEYKSKKKWEVFTNPFRDTMISNNDIVNFSLGYTYVGRQYYDKWRHWDTELACHDHYNYETLEFAFQVNLDRPQTISYSPEFVTWCQQQKVPTITTQIPIANAIDIADNLTHYRTILYTNSVSGNVARLVIN